MAKTRKENQYTGYRRPNVVLTDEEHREIAHYCIDRGMKIGEFIRDAALYCLRRGIGPGEERD